MTTATLTDAELARLLALADELRIAGKAADAIAVARAYVFAASALHPISDDEADEEFASEFEAGLRDLAEGRVISHAELLRRLDAAGDA